MVAQIEKILDRVTLGEAPHWNVATQSLYFVDIYGHAIHKYTPANKKHTTAQISDTENVSFIIPEEGAPHTFVVSTGCKVRRIRWDGESDKVQFLETLAELGESTGTVANPLNDAKCDPLGKLWTGTMVTAKNVDKEKLGSIFSLEGKNNIKQQQDGIILGNGLAWNSMHNKMYYIDSMKGTVDEYCYSPDGGISDCRAVFTVAKHKELQGLPDGMTIDSDDNLWVALFNGHCVIQIDPRKPETLLQVVKLPAKQTTSVAFGGPNLDELYVTSACIPIEGVELPEPEHGCTYRVTGLGVTGLPAVNFKPL